MGFEMIYNPERDLKKAMIDLSSLILNREPSFEQLPLPLQAFKTGLKEQKVESPDPSAEDSEETEREDAIICRACGIVITTPDEMIEIEGKSTHKFVNPVGVI